MTCRLCKHEFCWLCSGSWKDHGSATGGYYKCNKYDEFKQKGDTKITQEEQRIKDAKNELDKYMFYFERFNNHGKAEKHAKTLIPII